MVITGMTWTAVSRLAGVFAVEVAADTYVEPAVVRSEAAALCGWPAPAPAPVPVPAPALAPRLAPAVPLSLALTLPPVPPPPPVASRSSVMIALTRSHRAECYGLVDTARRVIV
jgi:hypothetical protein